jgi:hypothetical protein
VKKRPGETAEGERDEDELAGSSGPRDVHPARAAQVGAGERETCLRQCEAEGEHEREVAELRNHCVPCPALRCASSASPTCGGM